MLKPGHPDQAYVDALAERIRATPAGDEALELQWHLRDGFDRDRALTMLARSQLGLCDPDSLVVLRSNPSHYFLWDARHLCALATVAGKRGENWVEPSLARSSFFLACAGLDSFINAVYETSEALQIDRLVRLPPREKWLKASICCLPHGGKIYSNRTLVYTPGDPVATFDPAAEPFLSFSELWTIRNAMVHSHASQQVVTIAEANSRTGQPDVYPLTGIPKGLAHWRAEHARKTLRIAWAMIRAADSFFKGQLVMLRHSAHTTEVGL